MMTSVRGRNAGVPKIAINVSATPESALRDPDVRISASGFAPSAMPCAARNVPRLVAMTVIGPLDRGHVVNGAGEIGPASATRTANRMPISAARAKQVD